MKALVCVAALVAFAPALARAEAQEGAVDWQRRVVKCKGMAAPRTDAPNIAAARIGAQKAAQLDAQRNIVETLKGVKITGSKTVADAMQDPGVSAKVQGTIRNFRIVDTRYFSDGGVEVDVEMPIDGLIEQVAPPPAGRKTEAAPPVAPAAAKASGLVVDASHLKLSPAMTPRVLDDSGAALYGPAVAGYALNVDAAKADARVAGSPLVVKASSLAKDSPTDVVLSKEDAEKAKAAQIADGRVVFVIAQ